MKTAAVLLASLALAQGQNLRYHQEIRHMRDDMSSSPDYDFLKEQGMDPEAEFDMVIKNGMEVKDGKLMVKSYKGEVQFQDLEAMAEHTDRDGLIGPALADRLCPIIEGIFSNMVFCNCVVQILGLVAFQCVRSVDTTVNIFTFTPEFVGTFTFRLFALVFEFSGAVCAGDLAFYSEANGIDLNLGDFCVRATYLIDASLGGIEQASITDCTVNLGLVGACTSCTPCILPDGGVGVALKCTGTLPIARCIALALPFRQAPQHSFDTKGFVSDVYASEILSGVMADAEEKAAQAIAAAATPVPAAEVPEATIAPTEEVRNSMKFAPNMEPCGRWWQNKC